ncbi:hypothetical protein B0H34DRAFT_131400 [Crassisporium funariophilum]|nr:hypothetical protein B0H34DRAFT_131400 [Crassisporium funariophilum]
MHYFLLFHLRLLNEVRLYCAPFCPVSSVALWRSQMFNPVNSPPRTAVSSQDTYSPSHQHPFSKSGTPRITIQESLGQL